MSSFDILGNMVDDMNCSFEFSCYRNSVVVDSESSVLKANDVVHLYVSEFLNKELLG